MAIIVGTSVCVEAWIINAVESFVFTQDVGMILQIKIIASFIHFAFAFPTGDCTKWKPRTAVP